jgi:hypothetical protein
VRLIRYRIVVNERSLRRLSLNATPKTRYTTHSTGLPLTCQALQFLTTAELDQDLNRPLRIIFIFLNVYLPGTVDALERGGEPFIDPVDERLQFGVPLSL